MFDWDDLVWCNLAHRQRVWERKQALLRSTRAATLREIGDGSSRLSPQRVGQLAQQARHQLTSPVERYLAAPAGYSAVLHKEEHGGHVVTIARKLAAALETLKA